MITRTGGLARNLSLASAFLTVLSHASGANNPEASTPGTRSEPPPPIPVALFLGDVDEDSLDDAVVISPTGRFALFHNRGQGQFEDITLPSGLAEVVGASCALLADFDSDGRVDLFIGSAEKRLWRNLGGASFVPFDSGIEHEFVDFAASAIDHDRDGNFDLHLQTEAGELLYRNLGAGRFERVELSGVGHAPGVLPLPGVFDTSDGVEVDDADASPMRRRLARWRRLRAAAAAAAAANSSASSSALSANPITSSTNVGSLPMASAPSLICAGSIIDQATSLCLAASSNPTLGALYPLSANLNVGTNGHVGIGTTSPYGKLHVVGVNGTVFQVFDFGAPPPGADRLVAAFDGGAGIPSQVRFAGASGGFVDIGQNASGSFVVEGSDLPRLTVTQGGNVGIGTSAPETALNVKDGSLWVNGVTGGNLPPSAGRGVRVWHEGGLDMPVIQGMDWSTLIGIDLLVQPDGGNVGIGTLTPTQKLDVAGNATFSGNVGIGTTTPTSALTVMAQNSSNISALSGSNSVHAGINVGRTAAEFAMGISSSNGNWLAGSGPGDGVLRVTDPSKKILLGFGIGGPATMAVTSTNVGIGTASPTQKLEVSGNARISTLFADYGSSTVPTIGFVDTAENTGFSSPSSNTIAAITNGAERVRITSSGNVGIGTSAPLNKLQVVGQVAGGDHPGFNSHMMSSRVANMNATVDVAIFGSNEATSGAEYGVYGRCTSPQGFATFAEGRLGATGTKLFLQPHPTDASKEIRFVCLEGNESGTYFRGSAKLVGGRCVIDVPEDFRLVSEPTGLTVQVTAIGLPAALWIEARDLQHVVVRGNVDVDFDYFVNGVRRGYSQFETIGENTGYRPHVRGVPFGTQYPQEIRDLLVANGILNSDYTPNEATAAANGWTLVDPIDASAAPQPAEVERR